MPPKTKFTPELILDAAFSVVRQQGWKFLTARSIAKQLNSSTNPIYFHLESMANLQSAIMKKGIDLCLHYVKKNRTGDRWIDQGVGYVLFARDEKRLFRSINDEDYQWLRAEHEAYFWDQLDADVDDFPLFKAIADPLQEKIRRARSIFTYGMAMMVSGSIEYELMQSEKQITELIQVASYSLFKGLIEENETA